MKHIQLQTVETSNSTDSSDLASTQRWMIAAITAPGGLPEGLAQALKAYNQTIEDVIIAPPGISPHSRLDIYAQGYWLRLFACLKADYPSLQRLLGEPLFEFFARAYLVPARKPVKQVTISGEANSPTNKMGIVACFKGYFSTT